MPDNLRMEVTFNGVDQNGPRTAALSHWGGLLS